MMLKAYQLLTTLAGPLVALYLLWRRLKGKEDPQRFGERMGSTTRARPAGVLVWIHGASVGEALSVLPVIQKLADQCPDCHFMLTTGTVTSARLLETRLPPRTFHQYVPIDRMAAVTRFLQHWTPDVALWMESELWPNLVIETAKHCPMLLLNGRMSEPSYQTWLRYHAFGREILRSFALTLAQSCLDAERFVALGAPNVQYLGNIKFDAPPLPADPAKIAELAAVIGKRPVWLASSTHASEEVSVADVHAALKSAHPDLLTIIAPRHPKRAEEIVAEIAAKGLHVAQRSESQPITDTTDIYLADTLGELGIFYRLSPIVFIGGSLIDRGGQNPLEAARLDSAIVYGPYMDNFLEIKRELEECKAAVCVADVAALQTAIAELLTHPDKQRALADAAAALVATKSGVMDAFVAQIMPYIESKNIRT